MHLDTIIVSVIGLAGGIYIAVHEFRRRARRSEHREIDDLIQEVDDLRRLLLEQRKYIYDVVTYMIDKGMDPPLPPAPSFDKDEYPAHKQNKRSDPL